MYQNEGGIGIESWIMILPYSVWILKRLQKESEQNKRDTLKGTQMRYSIALMSLTHMPGITCTVNVCAENYTFKHYGMKKLQ